MTLQRAHAKIRCLAKIDYSSGGAVNVKWLAAIALVGATAACTGSGADHTSTSAASGVVSSRRATISPSPRSSPAPTPISIAVVSNLDHRGLAASLRVQGKGSVLTSGKLTLTDVSPGTPIVVTSAGYTSTTVTRGGVVVLSAGPGLTARYLAAQEIAQRYQVEADFVHPREYKYVSRKRLISYLRSSDNQGYSLLHWTLKSVTIVPRWRFPGCNGKGAETFKRVAAVEFTSVSSAPSGGEQSTHGVEHLVQSDGEWRWFPIVPNYCE